jgi:hypothetical protein
MVYVKYRDGRNSGIVNPGDTVILGYTTWFGLNTIVGEVCYLSSTVLPKKIQVVDSSNKKRTFRTKKIKILSNVSARLASGGNEPTFGDTHSYPDIGSEEEPDRIEIPRDYPYQVCI